MAHRDGFWKLEHLSDAQLLENLSGVLRTQRGALAELVAHLGEVEDRRLHLEAAYGSMFTYCVARLGMSEDEACRRIELARLARRFPALFAELESGQITLSVALVLKPVLSPSNHLELLAAARGKCVRQARELVAERFPKPDAPSSIRKLPERRPLRASDPGEAGASAPSLAAGSAPLPLLFTGTPANPSSAADLPVASPPRPSAPSPSLPVPAPAVAKLPESPALTPSSPAAVERQTLSALPLSSSAVEPSPPRSALTPSSPAVEEHTRPAPPGAGSAPPLSRSVIEPLSAQRYRIQFTADAALKQQLELARNLLRHANPSGDFGPVVARALSLLIDDLLTNRFGARARRTSRSPAGERPVHPPSPASASQTDANPSPSESAPNTPASEPAGSACSSTTLESGAPSARSAYVPRAARRAVFERDGHGCSWVDADGVRCGNQAWLELDHRQPRGKGGSSEPDNLRLLCRAHNLFAAEHAYGRDHIERCARRRQTEGANRPPA